MLEIPNRKHIRSVVIRDYVRDAGYPGVVVFTCGHSAVELRNEGLDVVEVGPRGKLKTDHWWSMEEIHRTWPFRLDVTSGHLPLPLMLAVAEAFKKELGPLHGGTYEVPTGSGETILCLRWVYPDCTFTPVYDVGVGTEYNEKAPLNDLVAMKPSIIK